MNLSKLQHFYPTIICLVLAGLIYCLPQSNQELLKYERVLINSGQLWRLLTAHFVHTGLNHLLMNCVALVLISFLYSTNNRASSTLIEITVIATFISASLYFFHPTIQWYVGFSGVLHGLFISGAFQLISRKDKLGWLMLAVCSTKLIIEQLETAPSSTEALIGAAVVVEAHAWGAIAGFVTGLFSTSYAKKLADG